jgi:hypothetical protein
MEEIKLNERMMTIATTTPFYNKNLENEIITYKELLQPSQQQYKWKQVKLLKKEREKKEMESKLTQNESSNQKRKGDQWQCIAKLKKIESLERTQIT